MSLNSEIGMEGQLVENVLKQLESEFSERISSTNTSNRVSADILEQITTEEERESIRKEFTKAMSVSSQMQRLYFVVRSIIMSILGALITFVIVWHLGTINVIGDFVLGISTYAVCLALSRLFDERIVNISRRIILYLEGHAKLRDFIVKTF
jgi:Flp pilus assembly protein TadB